MVRPSGTPPPSRQNDLGGRLQPRDSGGRRPDLHVEHVDLPVERADLAVGPDVHGGVRHALVALAALGDRAGDDVDPELARERTRPLDRAAVERLRPGEVVGRPPRMSSRSGRTTSSAPSAATARTSRSAEARFASVSVVHSSWTAAARIGPVYRSSQRLTDQSIQQCTWRVRPRSRTTERLRGTAGEPSVAAGRALGDELLDLGHVLLPKIGAGRPRCC